MVTLHRFFTEQVHRISHPMWKCTFVIMLPAIIPTVPTQRVLLSHTINK